MDRYTYSEIDLDAFKNNYLNIKKFTNKAIFSVCKANAYSHGDYEVAKIAQELGSPYICVSSFDEAMSLRQQGFDGNILVMGFVHAQCIEDIISYDITVSVLSYDWLVSLPIQDIAIHKLKVHLKIDTGMNRVGLKEFEEIEKCVAWFKNHRIPIEGIFTHLHSADKDNKESSIKQLQLFYTIVDRLAYPFVWIHTSNSDATLSIQDERSNALRVGLALYGIKSVASDVKLKPVLSLYSSVVHCKEVAKDSTVGYGATYTCENTCIIATLPIGYGDGFVCANQGRFVYIQDKRFEIVGRVCMDQTMIVLDEMVPIDTRVEIIGEHTTLTTMAKELHMIPYEVLCLLNDRITKVIKKDGKVIKTINTRVST